MPYENSGTPAPLISHALNEILALGIPRYTCGQLVRTAFFFLRKLHSWKSKNSEIQKNNTQKRVHTVFLRISTCKNVPRVLLHQTDINSAVCSMTPSSSMHLDCNSFLAWQQIHFRDNPAGSKGFSRHPYHALQGKCNKGRSTRCGHSLPATCYIPHSPASSHSLVTLYSHISSHSSVHLNSPHTCRKLHRSANCPCNLLDLVVCTCYSSDSLQQQYTNSFFTVSNRVSSSGI